MSELDAWLNRPPVTAAPAESSDDPWLEMSKSDPSSWRKRGNPHTQRIAQMIADDAMLPMDGQVAVNCRSVAAFLLEELGLEFTEAGIEDCRRRRAGWRDLSIYIMKSEILHAGARIKARVGFAEHLDDDQFLPEDPLVPCRKCGKMILAQNEEMDCRGH